MDKKKQKQLLLDKLYSQYTNCKLCNIGNQGRINIVFGEGNPDTKLLFIGEAPGKEEDIQKRPFIGRSGKLLTKILESLNLKREDIYITNVIKCRPPKNKRPLLEESNICKKNILFKQIKIIKPKIICTLGSCALESLLEKTVKITELRGKLIKNDFLILPTYHPAYILRNSSKKNILTDDIALAISLSKE